MDIEITDDTLKYQDNHAEVTNLKHDGGSSGCTFCKLEVTGKKKGLLGYSKKFTDTINTPSTGTFYGGNHDTSTGKYRYLIKNNGAYQNDGVFTVTARDYRM